MARSPNPWRRFLDRSNDDPVKIFGIAVLVAFVAAVFVSSASITLQPWQEAHVAAERQARMDRMLDTLPGLRDLMTQAGVDVLETRVVNLSDGALLSADAPAIDMQEAATIEETSTALATETDIAGLKRRANHAPVYLLQKDGKLKLVVLPMYGAGYQSTISLMLALEADLTTVAALTITSQGDTPGFGARIEEPQWQALWPGKKIANEAGEIAISVIRGKASGPYEVDGISGATRTSNGVSNILNFWLGDNGYGPFLDRVRKEGL